VGGIQGDYDWINAGFERNSVFFYAMTSLRAKSVASLTGRIGYSWDRFLGYVKFGGAWERDELTLNFFNGFVATASDTRIGWTIGIGAECALNARARLASTTLADLLTPLLVANPFSAMRASLRR